MGDGEPVACRPPVTHRQGRAPAALWALAPSAAPSSWVSSVVGATRRAGAALAPVTPVCRPASLQVVGERMDFVRQAEQGGRGRLPVAGLSVIKIRLATPVAATPERRPRVRPSPHPPPPTLAALAAQRLWPGPPPSLHQTAAEKQAEVPHGHQVALVHPAVTLSARCYWFRGSVPARPPGVAPECAHHGVAHRSGTRLFVAEPWSSVTLEQMLFAT